VTITLSSYGQVSVGTSPTQIVGQNTARAGVLITNPSTSTVYLGGSSVTTSTGQILPAGQSISLPATNPIYAVVASSTATVSFVEVS
jgi:2-keto-4-pentenoate hydratase